MAVCPFATWRPISVNVGPAMSDIRGFVAHSQVGYGSLFDVFNNPARKASTHFWISRKGELEQYVDTDVQAWAHGPGNPFYWSSEFEGMSYNDGPQEMDGDALTSAQLDMGGRLMAWLHSLHPYPVVVNVIGLNGYGLTPHRDLMQTACPGKLRLSQYPELVLATLRYLEPVPTKELPVVFIAKPDNQPSEYLVDTSSGLVAGFADGASRDNFAASGVPRISVSGATWDSIVKQCAELRKAG